MSVVLRNVDYISKISTLSSANWIYFVGNKNLLKKIMCIDMPHSIHSLCAIVACKNINPFFKAFFKFSVFFSSYFFLLCQNLSVIFLPLWWNTRFFKRKMFIRKWTSKTPKSSEKANKISSLKCLSCNLKSLIFPRSL